MILTSRLLHRVRRAHAASFVHHLIPMNALQLLTLGLIAFLPLAQGEVLYATDFDDFPVGDNAWAGNEGWVSNDTVSGAQAIDDSIFSGGLGNIASLGFTRPQNTFTSVYRAVNYDPSTGSSIIEIETLFGIEDSTNSRRDYFFLSIYNITGDFLGGLRLSNNESDYGIWRQDGVSNTYTEVDFIRGELHTLVLRIDLEQNTWSALLDDIAMFDEVQFSRTGRTRTFGGLGVEWEVAQGSPFFYGDNWLLLADLHLETVEPPELAINEISRKANGEVTLQWTMGPGYNYRVQHSADGVTWHNNLPDATKSSGSQFEEKATYTDTTAEQAEKRFYRLIRTPS